MNVTATMRGGKELEAKLGEMPPMLVAEANILMDQTLDLTEQMVVKEIPVGATAALRGSVAHEMHGSLATMLYGNVVHGSLYGDVVEVGRSAGKAPMVMDGGHLRAVPELELWVARKLGVSGDEVEGVAFAIARKIGRRGTKGAHMFEKAFKVVVPRIILYWQDLPGYVLRKAGLA